MFCSRCVGSQTKKQIKPHRDSCYLNYHLYIINCCFTKAQTRNKNEQQFNTRASIGGKQILYDVMKNERYCAKCLSKVTMLESENNRVYQASFAAAWNITLMRPKWSCNEFVLQVQQKRLTRAELEHKGDFDGVDEMNLSLSNNR